MITHKSSTNSCFTMCGNTKLNYNSTNSWQFCTCPECLKFRPKWMDKEYYARKEARRGNKRRKSI